MRIRVRHSAHFSVAAPAASVYALLADVPRAAAGFPHLRRLVPLGGDDWRWEMEPLALFGFRHQVICASRYSCDAESGVVSWTPLRGIGNGRLRGEWRVGAGDPGARVALSVHGEFDLALPVLLRGPATGFLQQAFEHQLGQYLRQLRAGFGDGGANRQNSPH